MFELYSNYKPTWDQPKVIENISKWYSTSDKNITLLWATGTWKTFIMANLIKELKKPTLIISHNKTLAAQLATEFKYFFPKNAVHYFVSYFDYYQPESYIPERDTYIEKDSSINEEIQMYRLSTMASLLSREDVVVVSSVSALYGLGKKSVFKENSLVFKVWEEYDFYNIKKHLINIQYKPVESKIERWMFDIKWEIVDIYSSLENIVYRLFFDDEKLEKIQKKDFLTFKDIWEEQEITIWPWTQFLQNVENLDKILEKIKKELDKRIKELKDQWKEIEAQRLWKKTNYDIRMIKETWFVTWIENYSLYFDQRITWEPPNTLFDYFPDDFFLIIDESHMTIPQLKAMPEWDKSRKKVLVENWFRLPSAMDHRPLNFSELKTILWWENTGKDEINYDLISDKIKKNNNNLFVSATPWEYELGISSSVVEQIIRPTGLLDPKTYVYPKSWDYSILLDSLERVLKKKPQLNKYFDWYWNYIDPKNIFFE